MLPSTQRASAQSLKNLRRVYRVAARRVESTTTSSTSPTPPPSWLKRNRRAIIWSSLGLTCGISTGALISHTVAPPPHPAPGSHEDAILVRDLDRRIDDEFKVKVLRGKCTAAAANLRGEDGSWRELPAASTTTTPAFLKQSLAGARGLGVERVFWNGKGKELVAVVWFGGATSGWPGVTHGGCIAAVMAEKMTLAARLAALGGNAPLPSSSEVVHQSADVNQLEINYKKPTYANAFYVVRMLPRHGEDGSSVLGEVDVDGTLETLQGKLCVSVSGSVPVSEVKTGAGQASIPTTQRAKSWIGWPSRSQASQ